MISTDAERAARLRNAIRAIGVERREAMAMVFVFSPSVWREVVLSGRRLQKELFV
jgi:hypothetical protein